MDVITNQPGVHIYVGGNCFGKLKGKENADYHALSGICFETQNFPDAPNHEHFPNSFLRKEEIDGLIVIGGDGTFLETLSHVGAKEIPILGINTGRLGFLATLSPEEVPQALQHVLSNEYSIEDRCLVSVDAEIDLFHGKDFGLNEVGIMKTDSSSMIQIKTFLDGNYLNTYWADGIIVSTATGSTGYSLSVGGPLVIPTSDSFIIAPMSPHNLNVRPLIVSSDSVLKFEVSSRSQNFLISIDSRSRVIDSKISIEVKKAAFSGKIVKIPGDDFLQTLRNKLNWGLDVRN